MAEGTIFYKHDVHFDTFWDMMIEIERIGHYFQYIKMIQTGYDRYSVFIGHNDFTVEQQDILKAYGFHKREVPND